MSTILDMEHLDSSGPFLASDCITTEQCTWVACTGLATQVEAGIKREPSGHIVASEGQLVLDPYELMELETTDWLTRESNVAHALEIFAHQGNKNEAIAAARQLRSREMAINRLMSRFAHSDRLYDEIQGIASSADEVEERIRLNALVESYRRQDSLRDKELFKKLLWQAVEAKLASAGTIVGHDLLEGTEPAV